MFKVLLKGTKFTLQFRSKSKVQTLHHYLTSSKRTSAVQRPPDTKGTLELKAHPTLSPTVSATRGRKEVSFLPTLGRVLSLPPWL